MDVLFFALVNRDQDYEVKALMFQSIQAFRADVSQKKPHRKMIRAVSTTDRGRDYDAFN